MEEFITEEKNGVQVLTGLKTVAIEWEKDEKGAWKMVEVEGSERIHDCDMCVLAMGFVGPEKVGKWDLTSCDQLARNTRKLRI